MWCKIRIIYNFRQTTQVRSGILSLSKKKKRQKNYWRRFCILSCMNFRFLSSKNCLKYILNNLRMQFSYEEYVCIFLSGNNVFKLVDRLMDDPLRRKSPPLGANPSFHHLRYWTHPPCTWFRRRDWQSLSLEATPARK